MCLFVSRMLFCRRTHDCRCHPQDSNSRHLAHLPYLRCASQLGCASKLRGGGLHIRLHHPRTQSPGAAGSRLQLCHWPCIPTLHPNSAPLHWRCRTRLGVCEQLRVSLSQMLRES
jgi:hypothetical protein